MGTTGLSRRSYRHIYNYITRKIQTFHAHTRRINAPGVGRADHFAPAAVHVVSGEIVAPFITTLSLSPRTYNTHIQAFRIITYGSVRADITAPAAVFHINGHIAAQSRTERLSPRTTLPIDARLSGSAARATGSAIPYGYLEIAAVTITPG